MDLNDISNIVNNAIISNLNKDLVKSFLAKTKSYPECQSAILREPMQAAISNIELFFANYPRLTPPMHSYFDCEGVFVMLWTRLDFVVWVCVSDEPNYSLGVRENKATKVLLHDLEFAEIAPADLQLFFLEERLVT